MWGEEQKEDQGREKVTCSHEASANPAGSSEAGMALQGVQTTRPLEPCPNPSLCLGCPRKRTGGSHEKILVEFLKTDGC